MLDVKSKSYPAFGCCGYWKKCDLGKGTCHYEVSYPAKMNVCAAYNRHRQQVNVQKAPELAAKKEIKENLQEEIAKNLQNEIVEHSQNETEIIVSDDGQLSLF